MTEIEILNKKIGDEYITIDGKKLFRLVWSESIFENRRGTFREFTESGMFIREVTETRKVRKYNYIHHRWIFEMWAPGNMTASAETPDAVNGDYVPVYVFEARDGSYLPPNEKVVRFLIAALYGKVMKDELPSQEYLDEREIQHTVDLMDDHPAWFQTRPGAARNAVAYRGKLGWHDRRATFDVGLVQEVERKALIDLRARQIAEGERREKELEVEREKVKEVLRMAEEQRAKLAEQEREASRLQTEKSIADEARRSRERLAHEKEKAKAKVPVTTFSPMHKGGSS